MAKKKAARIPKIKVKYIVVSYDNDEQQWFWDFVVSTSREDAAALVCKRRPYVIAADAITPSEVKCMANDLESLTAEGVDKAFKRVTRHWWIQG